MAPIFSVVCSCPAHTPHHPCQGCPVLQRWYTQPFIGLVGIAGVIYLDDEGAASRRTFPALKGDLLVHQRFNQDVPVVVLECLATWLEIVHAQLAREATP